MKDQNIHYFAQRIKDCPFRWEGIEPEKIELYLNMKPTIWKRILWIFFPTIVSYNYYLYRSFYKETKDEI